MQSKHRHRRAAWAGRQRRNRGSHVFLLLTRLSSLGERSTAPFKSLALSNGLCGRASMPMPLKYRSLGQWEGVGTNELLMFDGLI
jgi:hypothetical protein